MEAEGDHFLAYYLNKEDEEAETFIQHRLNRSSDIPVRISSFPLEILRSQRLNQ
jgi:hypothetical protein